MKDWTKSLPFAYSQRGIQHEVAGQLVEFWPVSPSVLGRLEELIKPLGKMWSALFAGDSRGTDQKYINRRFEGIDTGYESITEPMSVEMAQYRDEQKRKAIEEIMGAIKGDRMKSLIGVVILDSVRPRADKTAITDGDGLEFFDAVGDLSTLKDYLVGAGKAMGGDIGPLAGLLPKGLGEILTAAKTRLAGGQDPVGCPPSPEASESDDLQPKEEPDLTHYPV